MDQSTAPMRKNPKTSGSIRRLRRKKLLPEVELKIREHEALQKVLSQQIADPENQMDLEKSAALAAEYEKEQQLIDGFMEKWEALMEPLNDSIIH